MDLDELRKASDELAAKRADTRTPAVVRQALLCANGLTLRQYLMLEEAKSPALTGAWSFYDAEQLSGEFSTAWGIIFPGLKVPPASELEVGLSKISQKVTDAFATVLPVKFPTPPGQHISPPASDPIGWVARLVAKCFSLGHAGVLDMQLSTLFLMTAGVAINEGAVSSGADYKDRES